MIQNVHEVWEEVCSIPLKLCSEMFSCQKYLSTLEQLSCYEIGREYILNV